MALTWIREAPAFWNSDKARIVAGAPVGTLARVAHTDGEIMPGDWWHVEDDGRVVGYGWMDYSWGDAEILLAVDPAARCHGIGTYVLDRLEDEAAARGINYLYNVVSQDHPDRAGLERWLLRRAFAGSHEGGLLRRRVQPRAS